MFSLSVTAMAGMWAQGDDFVLDPDFSPQRRICCSLAQFRCRNDNDAGSLACCSGHLRRFLFNLFCEARRRRVFLWAVLDGFQPFKAAAIFIPFPLDQI